MASFQGRIGQQPYEDGDGTVPGVLVERFIGVWPGETCERTVDAPTAPYRGGYFADAAAWPKLEDVEARLMYADCATFLPDNVLVKVDRAGMAVGLETRAPLLFGTTGTNGWYRSNVQIRWLIDDSGSLESVIGCNDVDVTADTAGTEFTCTATSTGGTTTILARMEAQLETYERAAIEATRLTRARVRWHTDFLWSQSRSRREGIIGLPRKRADVILTGAAIYEAVMEEFGFLELRVSTRGLRFAAVMGDMPEAITP